MTLGCTRSCLCRQLQHHVGSLHSLLLTHIVTGECMATCDVKCNMNNGTLFQTFSPPTSVSCCGNGLEYPNQCYAQCVGGWTKAQLKSQCER